MGSQGDVEEIKGNGHLAEAMRKGVCLPSSPFYTRSALLPRKRDVKCRRWRRSKCGQLWSGDQSWGARDPLKYQSAKVAQEETCFLNADFCSFLMIHLNAGPWHGARINGALGYWNQKVEDGGFRGSSKPKPKTNYICTYKTKYIEARSQIFQTSRIKLKSNLNRAKCYIFNQTWLGITYSTSTGTYDLPNLWL